MMIKDRQRMQIIAGIMKVLQRTTLLSNMIHPTLLKYTFRKEFLEHKMLGPEHRQNGLDISRLKLSELNLLREVESKRFCAGEN